MFFSTLLKKLRNFSLLLSGLFFTQHTNAQCNSTNITGDFIQTSDIFLSGIYNVSGTFYVPAGVTIYVMPYSFGNCGKLEIYANKIIIEGTINGDYAGYTGGTGGLGGNVVTSITGDLIALDNCSNKDYTGQVTVEGGKGGQIGNGSGAGNSGANGANGSGPKQQCQNNNDEAGMIGSGGGAGGGGGASYGGNGSTGSAGGAGTNFYQTNGVNVSTGFVVVGGTGGNGGANGSTYGTSAGADIDLGSGGAGGGGGGRSYDVGLQGGKGGDGGGQIKFVAVDTLKITGTISVNGATGLTGGNGGSGGISPKCCSDGCDDSGEETLSCGAGAGSGGGGGSGGGIHLETSGVGLITGTLSAMGGNGGNGGSKGTGAQDTYSGGIFCGTQSISSGDGYNGSAGGAGGGGRIKIFVQDCALGNINPTTNTNGGTGSASANAGTYSLNCVINADFASKPLYALDIFPNPAKEEIFIRFKNSVTADDVSDITFTDASGRVVLTNGAQIANGSTQVVSLSSLSPGIYFVSMLINNKQIIQKIIKQ